MKNLKTFSEFISEAAEFNPTNTSDLDVLLPAIKSATELKPGKEYVIKLDGKIHTNMIYQGVSDSSYIFNSEDMETVLNLKDEQINSAVSDGGVQPVNESKLYKGKEVLPDWIDPKRDFGSPIKNAKELKVGAEYIIYEPGMDNWQAENIYQGYTGGIHIFNSSTQFGEAEPLELTDKDLASAIKDGEIIKQN